MIGVGSTIDSTIDSTMDLHHQRARAAALTRAIEPHLARLSTPTLVIDLDAVEHNVAAVLRRVGGPSRWRPHIKTIKQPTLVGLLMDAGVVRFKAATPAEVALVLDAAAARALPEPVDVLLAYPAAPPHLHAMIALRRAHPQARLGLLADSPEHATALVQWIDQSLHDPSLPEPLPAFDLWLDVDVGMQRTGSAAQVWRHAEVASSPWLRPVGLHGYEGHLQWSERPEAHAGYDALCELARALPLGIEQVCTSGTHAYAHALAHDPLHDGPWSHQVSPGTVVLSDRRSAPAAADLGLRQAAFVCSRVVARPGPGRITLDAGSKALAPDCPAPGCAVLGEPGWIPLAPSEEHRPVRIDDDLGPTPPDRPTRPPWGSLAWLVPDHVCTTVNLHAEALYVRTDEVVGSAPVLARGHRPWLALGGLLLALAGPPAGCQPITTELDVQLVLPPGDPELQRTNNVSVVLEPRGFTHTVAADGLDFGLTFEVPPDGVIRTLSVYLAEDDALLAWGRTPPFTYASAAQGISVLLARPGALVPLELAFSQPDARALAAPVADVGVLVLSSDGGTLFLDAYQYTLQAAASLEDGPAADDGVLVGAPDGGVMRVAWRDGVAAWRFDAVVDAWQRLELGGDLQPRPGAAAIVGPDGETLRIFGGGPADDVIALALPGTVARDVTPVDGLRLDGPRPGATVIELDGHPILVGGDDPTLPVAWRADTGQAAGPTTAWTGLACAPVTTTTTPAQALCVGGLRDGTATADALRLQLQGNALVVEELTNLLPLPLPAPLLLPDQAAVYAQGEGRWLRIDGTTVTELPTAAPRGSGGTTAALPSGATLLVGGLDVDGVPLDRWYAFAPNVEP